MTANSIRKNIKLNKWLALQGEIKNMLKIKNKNMPKDIGYSKQEQSDYVRFNLELLKSLL